MNKILLVLIFAGFLTSCKKEDSAPGADALLKGEWKANLTTDVIFDNATGAELTRVSYLHGLETKLTFDGAGSVTSYDTEYGVTLKHAYTLRTEGNRTYLSTQIVGFAPTEYEITALHDPDLQMKGLVISDSPYSIDGKNYRVHYERTQFFTKQ
ncbi:hypothetical protein [Mucilaginibacter psychrotolerans]|uniref:Lipocalin-like domain-containing protein n=1 Tax=Mucilaginibacter psychrotolerans TaxID=1524096 RepID=A0A4Y8S8V0_9SPHI|nr:hypothetical protein [Mucilaginibacter psychrotolerans]TFF35362.1 hypothetical protein E2R66_19085 [Mucilaginibacter psychrotolerans]